MNHTGQQPNISIFFRFDDITGISPIEVEKRLIDVFAEEKATCCVGVVPMITTGKVEDSTPTTLLPLSEAKISLIRIASRKGVFDVLLHGYSHQTIRQEDPHTEFCGRPYEEQYSLINKGKSFIEENVGTQVNCFIPPWNTYDKNTLITLDQLGVKAISANCYGRVGDEQTNLCYVPSTVGYCGIRKAIDLARKYNSSQSVIGILIHPYDFIESGDKRASISMDDLQNELIWLKEQNDIQLVSISQLILDTEIDVSKTRYLANKPPFYQSIIPSFAKSICNSIVYFSTILAVTKKIKQLIIILSYYAILFLLGLTLNNIAFGSDIFVGLSVSTFIFFYLAIMILLITRWIRHGAIYYKPFSLLITILGSLSSIMLALLSK